MFGYAGSLILLAFNLTMVMMPEWYGISDGSLPARILSVGIWWMGFTVTFHYLPTMSFIKPEKDYIFKGLRELRAVLDSLKGYEKFKTIPNCFFSL
jgi:UMF1 family MFS transporter